MGGRPRQMQPHAEAGGRHQRSGAGQMAGGRATSFPSRTGAHRFGGPTAPKSSPVPSGRGGHPNPTRPRPHSPTHDPPTHRLADIFNHGHEGSSYRASPRRRHQEVRAPDRLGLPAAGLSCVINDTRPWWPPEPAARRSPASSSTQPRTHAPRLLLRSGPIVCRWLLLAPLRSRTRRAPAAAACFLRTGNMALWLQQRRQDGRSGGCPDRQAQLLGCAAGH